MANSYLTKDFTSSPTNAKKFTVSVWFKVEAIGVNQPILQNTNTGGNQFAIDYRSDKKIGVIGYISSAVTSNHETTRLLLDPTSWYHLVVAGDSTLSTSTDRLKVYINGVRETSFSSATAITQNNDYEMNKELSGTSNGWRIGANHTASANNFFRGNIAHLHNVDGTAYAPTVFGETDSTTGGWKPILNPDSVAYGNNGWFLKFENAGALGTDSSGNGTTFTVTGNLKQSVSTPSNTFNTLNPNESYQTEVKNAIKYAGTGWEDAHTGADGPKGSVGILAMTSGKWYYEFKYASPSMYSTFGISKAGSLASSKMVNTQYRDPFTQGNNGDGFGFQVGNVSALISRGDNTQKQWLTDASNANSGITMASNGQICMVAFDLDAGKIWWGINGTWNTVPDSTTATSSSDIASGSNAHFTWTPDGEFYRSGHSEYNRFGNAAAQKLNFGEGRFGTDAVSSGNADSAGVGVFEYAPPTNFLAICTKNIKNTG
jgi:hypothetical protein